MTATCHTSFVPAIRERVLGSSASCCWGRAWGYYVLADSDMCHVP